MTCQSNLDCLDVVDEDWFNLFEGKELLLNLIAHQARVDVSDLQEVKFSHSVTLYETIMCLVMFFFVIALQNT